MYEVAVAVWSDAYGLLLVVDLWWTCGGLVVNLISYSAGLMSEAKSTLAYM